MSQGVNILDIIENKKSGEKLSREEIDYFVQGCAKEEIPDYQISALLMAICFNGMDKEETTNLTLSMARSGKSIDLSKIDGIKVDKHSSGGAADNVSPALVALVVANGAPVPKISGRGLGYGGGTIDKLESIPGFKAGIPIPEFIDIVNQVGGAIISQSENLVVADKKLYALRNATGTVDSLPLHVSSIMCKKIAAGADCVVLEVTMGSGAYMKDINSALTFAKTMVEIGELAGKKTVAYVIDMNQPLGDAIGNSIAIEETINVLKGKGGERLVRVIETLGGEMLYLGKKATSVKDGKEKIRKTIENGAGLRKFRAIVQAQGGNPAVTEDFSLLPQAKYRISVKLKKTGYIKKIETEAIEKLAAYLGAGRTKKDEKIDPSVGIVFPKKVGDRVEKGEKIALILANDKEKGEVASEKLPKLVQLSNVPVPPFPLIYYKVTKKSTEKIF